MPQGPRKWLRATRTGQRQAQAMAEEETLIKEQVMQGHCGKKLELYENSSRTSFPDKIRGQPRRQRGKIRRMNLRSMDRPTKTEEDGGRQRGKPPSGRKTSGAGKASTTIRSWTSPLLPA